MTTRSKILKSITNDETQPKSDSVEPTPETSDEEKEGIAEMIGEAIEAIMEGIGDL